MKNIFLSPMIAIVIALLSGCARTPLDISGETLGPYKKNPILAANSNIALGFDYLKKKKVSLAKEKFLKAISDAPTYAPSYYAMAFFMEKTKNTEQADQLYRYAITLEPKNGDAHNNYGTFLCRQKKYKTAISEFITATEQTQYLNVAEALENAGNCALQAQQHQQAVKYLKAAISNNPELISARLSLAKAYFKQHHVTKAYSQFSIYARYHKIAPNRFNDLMTTP